MRLGRRMVAALVMAAPAVLPAGADAAERLRVYEVVPRGRGQVHVAVSGANGFAAFVQVDRGGGAVAVPQLAFDESRGAAVRFAMTATTGDEVYVVGTAATTVRVPAGWRVRPVRVAARRVLADPAAVTEAGGVAVERFTGVRAPGGRHGSVAFGLLPCGDVGAGAATLSAAGADDAHATCPASPWVDAATRQAATWTFSGYGAAVPEAWRTRLFVLDLPPR